MTTRKQYPLHVIVPDAGWELEALGDRRREKLFRDRTVNRALLELPRELGRNRIFQRAHLLC